MSRKEKKEKANGGKGAAVKAALKSVGKMITALLPAIVILFVLKGTEMADAVGSIANTYIMYTVILYIPAIVLAAVYSYFKKGDVKRLGLRIAACGYTVAMLFIYAILIGGMLNLNMGPGSISVHLNLTMIAALLSIGPIVVMGQAYIEYIANRAPAVA